MARPAFAPPRALAHVVGAGALAPLALAAVGLLFALGRSAAGADPGELFDALARTLVIWLLAGLVALPAGLLLGLGCDRSALPRAIHLPLRHLVEQLVRTPPVLWGLVAAALARGPDARALAPVALALVALPRVALRTALALDEVPAPLREAATALGGGRRAVLAQVVWPAARRSALAGALEAMARAGGEAAPLLVLAGAAGAESLHVRAARVGPGLVPPAAAAAALALAGLVALVRAAALVARRGPP